MFGQVICYSIYGKMKTQLLLDAIKMRWRKQSEIAWLQQFERAEKYYLIHGD